MWSAVRWWIADLALTPWQAPSVPFPELSNQPEYEVRSAVVPQTGIEVIYRHHYATDLSISYASAPPGRSQSAA